MSCEIGYALGLAFLSAVREVEPSGHVHLIFVFSGFMRALGRAVWAASAVGQRIKAGFEMGVYT